MGGLKNKNNFASGFRLQASGLFLKHATCNMRRAANCYILFFICFLSFGILMSGCTAIIEGVKGIAGVSTRSLEKGRKDAVIKSFNYDYFTCYTKTWDILKQIGAHIYAQNIKKHMIAIYVSKEDTTPVGIFFKEIDASHTQVEVSSPSTYAKELIAGKISNYLVLEK